MLATAADQLPEGPEWIFEFKWDGIRALIEIVEGRMLIRSRRGNEVTIAYPELSRLGTGIEDALLDGEIVALAAGRPSFGLLQTRMHVRGRAQAAELAAQAPVSFIAFDVLRLHGVDVTARPLQERRATLERLAANRPRWTLSPVFDDGAATELAARKHGLEGVVAKRLTSRYRPGVRGPEWIKKRFMRRAEFVVVGWEADAERPGMLSSLLLGYYEDGTLLFAGKVGSGLSLRAAEALQRRLTPRETSPLAVDPAPSPRRVVTWVEPAVVVEVTYSQWALDGRLRQPVFLGVRPDKVAREVRRDG
jgi:bifunctional non-homologous end joining protein LigD